MNYRMGPICSADLHAGKRIKTRISWAKMVSPLWDATDISLCGRWLAQVRDPNTTLELLSPFNLLPNCVSFRIPHGQLQCCRLLL